MWDRLQWVALGVAALSACGGTARKPLEVADAGGATSGNQAAGATNSAGQSALGGATSSAGQAAQGGTGGSNSAGAASDAACVPELHERPEPAALTESFDAIGAMFAGTYQIDEVYEAAGDCDQMCRTGSVLGPKGFAYAYLVVAAGNGSYNIGGCRSLDECLQPSTLFGLTQVDQAKSDTILASHRDYVSSPQGQTCEGGNQDNWLIGLGTGKIQLDLETVRAQFAAVFDSASGLDGCRGQDAATASQGKACNELTVLKATRVK